MTTTLLAEFGAADTMVAAARAMREAGFRPVDSFTPYPVKAVEPLLEIPPSRIRVAMFVGGAAMAGFAFWLQWYSAVYDYPINSGGRPLNSWPVFLLVPFEVGVLGAALAGFVAWLWGCGLPRLNHPLFDVAGIERASQTSFFLAVADPGGEARGRLREGLSAAGASFIVEVEL
jgi:hypothetical protein